MGMRSIIAVSGLCLLLLAGGCGVRYVAPGGPADMKQFTHRDMAKAWNRKPAAEFPAHVAVARVQASGYRAHQIASHGRGAYSVVSIDDVRTDTAMAKIKRLPQLAGVATLNRLLLPRELNSDVELRHAAAALQADMLFLYTLDTQFHTDKVVPHAGLLTLGVFPDRSARVNSSASGLLLDTRSGYIYAAVEAGAHESQPANAWTSRDAVDDARRRAEQKAFDGMVDQIVATWPAVVQRHGRAATSEAR